MEIHNRGKQLGHLNSYLQTLVLSNRQPGMTGDRQDPDLVLLPKVELQAVCAKAGT